MRYVGSKRRLAKEILPFINKALRVYPMGKYIEPFAGGFNVIDKVRHHTRIGCDANKCLIELLHTAKNNPDKIRDTASVSRANYKYIRDSQDLFQEWYVGLMGLMPTYSNKWMHSFYDDLNPGAFSGSVKCLLKQNLSGIKLKNCDYQQIPVGKGNVFYCDPPYKIWDYYDMPFNHDEFYEWVRLTSRDNIVLVSEYEMPSDFTCIWQKVVRPGINSKARFQVEKLFIYKP